MPLLSGKPRAPPALAYVNRLLTLCPQALTHAT